MIEKIEQTLENLVTPKNSLGRQIITGYNFFSKCLYIEDYAILTLSHIHTNLQYFLRVQEALQEMSYPNKDVGLSRRDKRGVYKWKPKFRIRDDEGELYKDLKIKNIETGDYHNLERIPYGTLREAGFSDAEIDKLVGQDKGYEINIFLSNEEDLLKLAQEFIRRSSEYLVDEEGNIVFETSEELRQRDPWPGSYETPVIVIGGDLSRIKDSIPSFRDAYLFRFQDATVGEYNFVIRKFIWLLTQADQYFNLLDFGFKKENCLANVHFIRNYVDNL